MSSWPACIAFYTPFLERGRLPVNVLMEMGDDQYFRDIQTARIKARWRKEGARTSAQPRQASRKGKSDITPDQQLELWKKLCSQAQEAGILPAPRLPDVHRVKHSVAGQVAAVTLELNAPLFVRAKARMERERGKDLPDGYWGKKQRLYFAAVEELVDDTKDEMYKIVAIAHLMKETGAMLRGKSEMARRITEEEERAIEASVRAMSDEELGLTRNEPWAASVDSEQDPEG